MANLIVPSRWPGVRKSECFNGEDYRAAIKRRLFEQQVFDYGNGTATISGWGSSNNWDSGVPQLRPNGGATAEDGPLTLGWMLAPPGLGYRKIKAFVRWKVTGASAATTDYAYVDFEVLGTGQAKTITIPRKSEENEASVELPPHQGPWKVSVRLADPAAADTDYVQILGLSAFWRPPTGAELLYGDALPSTAWTTMSMNHWAGGRPEPSHALIWLMEQQARQYAYRPRPCWHQWFAARSTNSSTFTRVWQGRVYMPAHASNSTTLKARIGSWETHSAVNGYQVGVWVNGVQIATSATINTGDHQLTETTVSGSWSNGPGEYDVEVRAKVIEGGTVEVLFCGFWLEHTPATVGGESIPATFENPAWTRVLAGSPIHERNNIHGDPVGIETLVRNCYWLEKNHVTRGIASSFSYRWRPYQDRGTNDDPAPFSVAGADDTTTTMPNSKAGRTYDRRLHVGCADDPGARRSYDYYLALSMGRIDVNDQGALSSPVFAKVVHGASSTNEIAFSERGLQLDGVERPDVLWSGPFRMDDDMTGDVFDLNVDLWRQTRGGDSAPFLAGMQVVGRARDS